jgi:hypothetical protein
MNSSSSCPKVDEVDEKVSFPNRPNGTQVKKSGFVSFQPKQHAEPLRIALVENDQSVFTALKEMAKSENWKVEYYPDSIQALQYLPKTLPHVALVGIGTSPLSSISPAQKLK